MRTFRSILTAAALTAATAGLSACGSSTPAAAPAAPATSAPATSAPATSAPTTSAPAAASSGAASAAAAPAATGTLTTVDQNSDGKSVAVASVDLKGGGKGGWIALHSDLNGKPGPAKYFVAVPDGASSNVTIPTPDGIPTGAYWPMLHIDDKVIGTYEFPQVAGADLPAMANGMIVMKKITVTVK